MNDVMAAIRTALDGPGNGVVSVYLFGSRARGVAHAESDVDVGIVFDHVTLPDRAARARRALQLAPQLIAATHCNRVDVVALDDAPPELAARVISEGVRIVCADAEADHAFVRRTLLLAADQAPFLRRVRRLKLGAIAP
jgi:predicted nucleotidyltransferase